MFAQAKVTKQLFAEFRRLIPGIPEKTFELSITLRLDSFPSVACKSLVMQNGEELDSHIVFHVTEVTGVHKKSPITKPASAEPI